MEDKYKNYLRMEKNGLIYLVSPENVAKCLQKGFKEAPKKESIAKKIKKAVTPTKSAV